MKHPTSDALWARAQRVIPGGTQTLSKAPSQFVRGVHPKYLVRGQGARVWDADGHEYLDYPMALGAVLLGHGHPAVAEAVAKVAREGSLFTLLHPLEVEVAERLCDMVPCAEQVRFLKNGSDATAAAIRLARSYTGRERVAHCGYHGWQDWYAGATVRPSGVPAHAAALLSPFEYNRIETLEAALAAHPGEFAAVIFEHGGDEPKDGFLGKVRDLAHQHGAVFVWDEIVTGFRYARGGAQELFGVTPDLACLGKALGNGVPIAAVAGNRALMGEFDRVFVSSTFGGDAIGLAAAKAVLDTVASEPVVPHLWELGARWLTGARAAAKAANADGLDVVVGGAPPRSHVAFAAQGGVPADAVRSLWLQECVRRGILFGVPIFMSFGHTAEDVDRTLSVFAEALGVVTGAVRDGSVLARLDGPPVEPIARPAAPGAPAMPLRRAAGSRR